MKQKVTYVPVLTTEAGNCLTLANWQEIGINTVVYQLEALLMKPGISLLESLPDLKSYTGWQETIILNAVLPSANREGVYTIRSPYDGSVMHIRRDKLFKLIAQLQPDMVVLPEDFDVALLQSLPQTILPFLAAKEFPLIPERAFGWYRHYEPSLSYADYRERGSKPIYLAGEWDLDQAIELAAGGAVYVESNLPAKNALLGKVYCQDTVVDLLDSEMASQHAAIDQDCQCPTCEQKLTRAYLHHLLNQTPLLCQRFLIQHNAFYYQNYCNSLLTR